ncbi:WxL domain-containing protein [Lapidilactobacillus salsurivasis]
MKATKTITLLAALTLGIFTTSVATAHAEVEPQKSETTASINLKENAAGLQLTQAPDIFFDETEITGKKQTVNSTKVTPTLQVVNAGVVLPEGWSVSAARSEFKDGEKVLAGAQLGLGTPKLHGESSEDALAANSTVSAPASFELNDSAANIFYATDDKAIGTFNANYAGDGATLELPANATAGAYSAAITWTLAAAPNGK